MTDSRESCPEGWDPAELLAYLEGDLKSQDARKLKEHLRTCEVCSVELESLRRFDTLLNRHPESFHPDRDELYRLSFAGEDATGPIATHVGSCPTCKEDLEILREMISLRESRDEPAVGFPSALAQEFERIHGEKGQTELSEGRLRALWRRLLGIPHSLPVLTVGTAAAVFIIAVFAVPMWKSYVEPPLPAAVPSAPASKPAESPITAQQATPEDERAPLSKSQDIAKQKEFEKQEPRQGLEGGTGQLRGKFDDSKSNNRPSAGEDSIQRGAPAKLGRTMKESEPPAAAPAPVAERKRAAVAVRPGAVPTNQLKSREDHEKAAPKGEAYKPQKLEKKVHAAKPVAGLADAATKTPVEVRIVDAQGRNFQGITFVPPTDRRFAFSRRAAKEEKDRVAEKPAPEIAQDRGASARIIIKITGEGADYDLEGQLFRGDSAAAEQTIKIERVAKADLTRSVQHLVSSLIADRDDGHQRTDSE